MVALSGPLLGEKIRAGQWVAVGTGLLGVLFVLRPTPAGLGWGTLIAMGAAVCSALYQIVSRKLSHTERPVVGLFYVTLVGMIVLGALAIPVWQMPLPQDWIMLIVMGVIAATAYYGIFKAIELASPARLAPFYYLQIMTGVGMGYAMFDDTPDAWAILGMVVIVTSGLVCMGMERRRATGIRAAGE